MPGKARADLVLQGGGVKGIALAGAVAVLMKRFEFRRVAGTSAGAILASLLAAGYTGAEVRAAMLDLRYAKVPDPPMPLPLVSSALSLVASDGAFRGDYIREWVGNRLADKNVHTFADLPLYEDRPGAGDVGPDPALAGDRAYRLVVTATDVTRGQALRLPWDYRDVYGLDPATQSVADAVRMSLSIPLFFRPCQLVDARTGAVSRIVDGGVLANFPVEIFDRQDGERPRWPTLGVGIVPDLPGGDSTLIPHLPRLPGPLGLLSDVVTTAILGHDQTYLRRPKHAARVLRIDTSRVSVVDFGIAAAPRAQLFTDGERTARDFLGTWDWPGYLDRCYPAPARQREVSGASR